MKSRQKKSLMSEIRESIPAYLLILPTILVFIIFLYIPFANAIRISLYKYKGIGELPIEEATSEVIMSKILQSSAKK